MILSPTARGLPALFQEWKENFGQMLPTTDSILVNWPLAGHILFRELGIQTVIWRGIFFQNPPPAVCLTVLPDTGNPEQGGTTPQGKAFALAASAYRCPIWPGPVAVQGDNYSRMEWEPTTSRAQHEAVLPFPEDLLKKQTLWMTQMRKWETGTGEEESGRGNLLIQHVSLAIGACRRQGSAPWRGGGSDPGRSRSRQRQRRRPAPPAGHGGHGRAGPGSAGTAELLRGAARIESVPRLKHAARWALCGRRNGF